METYRIKGRALTERQIKDLGWSDEIRKLRRAIIFLRTELDTGTFREEFFQPLDGKPKQVRNETNVGKRLSDQTELENRAKSLARQVINHYGAATSLDMAIYDIETKYKEDNGAIESGDYVDPQAVDILMRQIKEMRKGVMVMGRLRDKIEADPVYRNKVTSNPQWGENAFEESFKQRPTLGEMLKMSNLDPKWFYSGFNADALMTKALAILDGVDEVEMAAQTLLGASKGIKMRKVQHDAPSQEMRNAFAAIDRASTNLVSDVQQRQQQDVNMAELPSSTQSLQPEMIIAKPTKKKIIPTMMKPGEEIPRQPVFEETQPIPPDMDTQELISKAVVIDEVFRDIGKKRERALDLIKGSKDGNDRMSQEEIERENRESIEHTKKLLMLHADKLGLVGIEQMNNEELAAKLRDLRYIQAIGQGEDLASIQQQVIQNERPSMWSQTDSKKLQEMININVEDVDNNNVVYQQIKNSGLYQNLLANTHYTNNTAAYAKIYAEKIGIDLVKEVKDRYSKDAIYTFTRPSHVLSDMQEPYLPEFLDRYAKYYDTYEDPLQTDEVKTASKTRQQFMNKQKTLAARQQGYYDNHPGWPDLESKYKLNPREGEKYLKPMLFNKHDIMYEGELLKSKGTQPITEYHGTPSLKEGWDILYGPANDFMLRLMINRPLMEGPKYGSHVNASPLLYAEELQQHLNEFMLINNNQLSPFRDDVIKQFSVNTGLLKQRADDKGRSVTNRELQAGLRAAALRQLGDIMGVFDDEELRKKKKFYFQLTTLEGLPKEFYENNLLGTRKGMDIFREIYDEFKEGYADDLLSLNVPGGKIRQRNAKPIFYQDNRQYIDLDADRLYGISTNIEVFKRLDRVFRFDELMDGNKDQLVRSLVKEAPGKQVRVLNQVMEDTQKDLEQKVGNEPTDDQIEDVDAMGIRHAALENPDHDIYFLYGEYVDQIQKAGNTHLVGPRVINKMGEDQPFKQKLLMQKAGNSPGAMLVKDIDNIIGSVYKDRYFNIGMQDDDAPSLERVRRGMEYKELRGIKDPEERRRFTKQADSVCCICMANINDPSAPMKYMQCCGRNMHQKCFQKYGAEIGGILTENGSQFTCPYCNFVGSGLVQNPKQSVAYKREIVDGRQYDPAVESKLWMDNVDQHAVELPDFRYSIDLYDKLNPPQQDYDDKPYTYMPTQPQGHDDQALIASNAEEIIRSRLQKYLEPSRLDSIPAGAHRFKEAYDYGIPQSHRSQYTGLINTAVEVRDLLQETMANQENQAQAAQYYQSMVTGMDYDQNLQGLVYAQAPPEIQQQALDDVQYEEQQNEIMHEADDSQEEEKYEDTYLNQQLSRQQEQQQQQQQQTQSIVIPQINVQAAQRELGIEGDIGMSIINPPKVVWQQPTTSIFNVQEVSDKILTGLNGQIAEQKATFDKSMVDYMGMLQSMNNTAMNVERDKIEKQYKTKIGMLETQLTAYDKDAEASKAYARKLFDERNAKLDQAREVSQRMGSEYPKVIDEIVKPMRMHETVKFHLNKYQGDYTRFQEMIDYLSSVNSEVKQKDEEVKQFMETSLTPLAREVPEVLDAFGGRLPSSTAELLYLEPGKIIKVNGILQKMGDTRKKQLEQHGAHLQTVDKLLHETNMQKKGLYTDEKEQYQKLREAALKALGPEIVDKYDKSTSYMTDRSQQGFIKYLQTQSDIKKEEYNREVKSIKDLEKTTNMLIKSDAETKDMSTRIEKVRDSITNVTNRLGMALHNNQPDAKIEHLLNEMREKRPEIEKRLLQHTNDLKDLEHLQKESESLATSIDKIQFKFRHEAGRFNVAINKTYDTLKTPVDQRDKLDEDAPWEKFTDIASKDAAAISSLLTRMSEVASQDKDKLKEIADVMERQSKGVVDSLKHLNEAEERIKTYHAHLTQLDPSTQSHSQVGSAADFKIYLQGKERIYQNKLDDMRRNVQAMEAAYSTVLDHVHKHEKSEKDLHFTNNNIRNRLSTINYPNKDPRLGTLDPSQFQNELNKVIQHTMQMEHEQQNMHLGLEEVKAKINAHTHQINSSKAEKQSKMAQIQMQLHNVDYPNKTNDMRNLNTETVNHELLKLVGYKAQIDNEANTIRMQTEDVVAQIGEIKETVKDKERAQKLIEEKEKDLKRLAKQEASLSLAIRRANHEVEDLTKGTRLFREQRWDEIDEALTQKVGWTENTIKNIYNFDEFINANKFRYSDKVSDFLIGVKNPMVGETLESTTKASLNRYMMLQDIANKGSPGANLASLMSQFGIKNIENKFDRIYRASLLFNPDEQDPDRDTLQRALDTEIQQIRTNVEQMSTAQLYTDQAADRLIQIDEEARFNTRQKFSTELKEKTLKLFEESGNEGTADMYKKLIGTYTEMLQNAQAGRSQTNFNMVSQDVQSVNKNMAGILEELKKSSQGKVHQKLVDTVKTASMQFVRDLKNGGDNDAQKYLTNGGIIDASALLSDHIFKVYGTAFNANRNQKFNTVVREAQDGLVDILFENDVGMILPAKDEVKKNVADLLKGMMGVFKEDVVERIAGMSGVSQIREGLEAMSDEQIADILSGTRKITPDMIRSYKPAGAVNEYQKYTALNKLRKDAPQLAEAAAKIQNNVRIAIGLPTYTQQDQQNVDQASALSQTLKQHKDAIQQASRRIDQLRDAISTETRPARLMILQRELAQVQDQFQRSTQDSADVSNRLSNVQAKLPRDIPNPQRVAPLSQNEIEEKVKRAVNLTGSKFMGSTRIIPTKVSQSIYNVPQFTTMKELQNFNAQSDRDGLIRQRTDLERTKAAVDQERVKYESNYTTPEQQNQLTMTKNDTIAMLASQILPKYIRPDASYQYVTDPRVLENMGTVQSVHFNLDLVENLQFVVPVILSEAQAKIDNGQLVDMNEIYKIDALGTLASKSVQSISNLARVGNLPNYIDPNTKKRLVEIDKRRDKLANINTYIHDKSQEVRQWNAAMMQNNLEFLDQAVLDIDNMVDGHDKKILFNKEIDIVGDKVEAQIEQMIMRGGLQKYLQEADVKKEVQQLSRQAGQSIYPRMYQAPQQMGVQRGFGGQFSQQPQYQEQVQRVGGQPDQQQQRPFLAYPTSRAISGSQQEGQEQQQASADQRLSSTAFDKMHRLDEISGEEIQFMKNVIYNKTLKRMQFKTADDKYPRDMTKEEAKKCIRIMVKILVAMYTRNVKKLSKTEKLQAIERLAKKFAKKDPGKLLGAVNKVAEQKPEGERQEQDEKMQD